MAGHGARPRWGRRHTLLAFTVAAMFLAYTDRVNIAVAAVAMRADLHWSQTVKGLVLAAFFVGYMLFQVPSGALARRYGGKRVFAAAVLWWSAWTLLTPVAATLSVGALLVARLGLGLGEAALMPAGYELFGRWMPPTEHGRTIGRFLGGIPIGQVVGFAMTGWLTAHAGWPASFYLFGALGFVWAVAWLASVENDPARDRRVGDEERALLATCAGARAAAVPAATPWRRFLAAPAVWALVAAHFSHNWTLYMLVSWLPSYFAETHGLSVSGAGLYAALPWAVNFAALQLSGTLSDRAIARGVAKIVVRRIGAAGGLAGAALCLLLLRSVATPAPALALSCLATGSIALAAASIVALPLDLSPRHAPVLIGFSNTFATIPGIAGVAITGWLVDVTHTYAAAFYVSALVSLAGAAFFLRFASAQEIDADR